MGVGMVCVHACMRECGGIELEVCTALAYPHIGSFCTMPVLCIHKHTHTRILRPFEDIESTGLKQNKSETKQNVLITFQLR